MKIFVQVLYLSTFFVLGILGYLKQEFALITADKMTYISNAITDGKNKINLRVKDTTGQSEFPKYEKGCKVKVNGFVDVDGKIFKFQTFIHRFTH